MTRSERPARCAVRRRDVVHDLRHADLSPRPGPDILRRRLIAVGADVDAHRVDAPGREHRRDLREVRQHVSVVLQVPDRVDQVARQRDRARRRIGPEAFETPHVRGEERALLRHAGPSRAPPRILDHLPGKIEADYRSGPRQREQHAARSARGFEHRAVAQRARQPFIDDALQVRDLFLRARLVQDVVDDRVGVEVCAGRLAGHAGGVPVCGAGQQGVSPASFSLRVTDVPRYRSAHSGEMGFAKS